MSTSEAHKREELAEVIYATVLHPIHAGPHAPGSWKDAPASTKAFYRKCAQAVMNGYNVERK